MRGLPAPLVGLGYSGSERTTRRAVAAVKGDYRLGRVRVHRPWVTEPGMWLQYDFGDGRHPAPDRAHQTVTGSHPRRSARVLPRHHRTARRRLRHRLGPLHRRSTRRVTPTLAHGSLLCQEAFGRGVVGLVLAGPGRGLSEGLVWGLEPVALESESLPRCPPGPVLLPVPVLAILLAV